MLRLVALICPLLAAAAWGQSDPQAEVRAALEEKAPVPSTALRLPTQADLDSGLPAQASQTAKARAAEAVARAKALALSRMREAARDPRNSLGSAGQSAEGQARAEEAKKNSRANKPPRPVP